MYISMYIYIYLCISIVRCEVPDMCGCCVGVGVSRTVSYVQLGPSSGYRQVVLAPGNHRGCFLLVLGELGDVMSGRLVANQMGG